ncbi:MAG: signal peptidase II [Eubacteriaceae bacterium]
MIYIAIIIFTVFLDQYSKYLVLTHLTPIGSFQLLPGIFHLTYAENRGAAFSLFSNMQFFLISITFIFAILLSVILYKSPKKREYLWENISIAVIIGGALGNLIDRLRLDFVVDFLDFHLINFAIFNFADCFVVCGSISLILSLIFNKKFLEEDVFKKLK